MERKWFKEWITEGYSVRQLVNHSGHSRAKINRIINYHLNYRPNEYGDLSQIKYIVFDGTFLHGRKSIVVAMDAVNHIVFAGKYGISESSLKQLITFFSCLERRGLEPITATVDGNKTVIKALKQLWPAIIVQRCLIHIQRQGLSWCRINPKRKDARELRKIFLQANKISDCKERNQFISGIRTWEKQYGYSIAQASERGKVFSDLKRARSMLLNALPDMFHYLKYPSIPPSTNGMEGYFSRLKDKYRQHRGLSTNRSESYFALYFYWCKK